METSLQPGYMLTKCRQGQALKMGEKNSGCPFCGSEKVREREDVIHYSQIGKEIKIYRCQECELDFFESGREFEEGEEEGRKTGKFSD